MQSILTFKNFGWKLTYRGLQSDEVFGGAFVVEGSVDHNVALVGLFDCEPAKAVGHSAAALLGHGGHVCAAGNHRVFDHAIDPCVQVGRLRLENWSAHWRQLKNN